MTESHGHIKVQTQGHRPTTTELDGMSELLKIPNIETLQPKRLLLRPWTNLEVVMSSNPPKLRGSNPFWNTNITYISCSVRILGTWLISMHEQPLLFIWVLGQNDTDKMVWTKMVWTKWYTDKMVYGQIGIGQNGTDKMCE